MLALVFGATLRAAFETFFSFAVVVVVDEKKPV
jgi:hypothetical protein